MTSDIDAQFVHRIASLENHLLDPIIDHSSLPEFNRQWTSFADDLQEALDADRLSVSTISMSHALADRISSVIQAFSDLEIISASIVAALPEPQHTHTTADSDTTPSQPPSPFKTKIASPYLQIAYTWFLKNIHNPYPSALVRDQIAKDTSSARKDIDGWFIEARKRVGWNALRKSHFSNKRVDIVDAAARFFVENDPERPIDPNVASEFAALEVRVKDLYSEKFSESDLLLNLDMTVKDMTPEMKALAKADKRRRNRLEKEEAQTKSEITSYPSPDCSPIHSPLSLTSEDDLEDIIPQSISQSSRKRRASSTDSSEKNYDGPLVRSTKRHRLGSSTYTEHGACVTGLPSPAPSVVSIDDTLSSQPTTPIASNGRKRRLSDADGQGAPKRPHNVSISSKSQTVSNPLPLLNASQLDGWFHEYFDFTVPHVETDSSALLDVELYDFSKIHDDNQLGNVVQYPSPQIQDRDALSRALDVPDTPSFDLDISTNSLNYDELFSSDNYFREVGRQDVANGRSSFSYELPTSTGADSSPNFFNVYEAPIQPAHTVDQALIVNALSPVSNNPAASYDWEFPSFISLPSQATAPGDKFQNLLNTFPHWQDINVSSPMMNMNSSVFLQKQVPILAERAAKKQKLFKIQETARRLEAELAALPC